MDGVMFSADRGDTDEPQRIVQLADLYARIIKLAGKVRAPCGSSLGQALLRLHDVKGSLTAMWSCRRCATCYMPVVDRLWNQMGHGPTTHVCADEAVAVAYAYAMRQLKYDDTNKDLARALIRGCIQHFS